MRLRPRNRRSERGTVLALVALLLPVLLGILGLVVDNGCLYSLRRKMQSAADAAVLVAAHEVRRGNDQYKAAALKDAERNGFKPSSSVTVDVYNPPKHGIFAGDPGYLEVEIKQDAPLFFMRALHESTAMVTARAVSGMRPGPGCIFVLNPDVDDALDLGGGALIKMPSCIALVNSSSTTAAVQQGSSQMISQSTQVVGDYTGTAWTPKPKTGINHFLDPLAGVPDPVVGACTYSTQLTISSDTTLNPGVYCGGINVKKGTVTLTPGVYIMNDGGLNVATSASLKGNGVMIYNTFRALKDFAPLNIACNSPHVVQLSAPADGTYQGVLLFQDRRVTRTYKNYLTKGTGSTYEGYLYFKSSGLRFTGGATLDATRIVFVTDTLELRGNMAIQAPGYLPAGTGDVRLVE